MTPVVVERPDIFRLIQGHELLISLVGVSFHYDTHRSLDDEEGRYQRDWTITFLEEEPEIPWYYVYPGVGGYFSKVGSLPIFEIKSEVREFRIWRWELTDTIRIISICSRGL